MNNTTVGPFAWSSSMAAVFKATPLPPPLCNGLVDGAVEGFFFNTVNWPMTKLIGTLINFILVFNPPPTRLPPKQFNRLPPCSPPVKPLPLYHLSCTHVFWVDCYVVIVVWGPPKATTYLFFDLFCTICHPQTMIRHPPHNCGLISFLMSPPLLMLTLGWLLCFMSKRWPPKAKILSLSLLFKRLLSLPQTREPAATFANLPPGTCNGPMESRSAKI
jgi:hypothetical protein